MCDNEEKQQTNCKIDSKGKLLYYYFFLRSKAKRHLHLRNTMAELGADVQATSNELVGIMEQLKERRTELDRIIQKEEEAKGRIEKEMKALQERLTRLSDGLDKKYAARQEFDKTIHETTAAFNQILDSSRLLLSSVKQDTLTLTNRSQQ